ncbi:MAG: hypothetical protein AMXMBFR13_23960 [Phycisphaerae bacterium]
MLPTGFWRGSGAFVYEAWPNRQSSDSASGAATPTSLHGDYPTTLSIRPGELDGHAVVMLEIESLRATLPDLGDKTYLRAALVEAKRLSEGVVLYRLVALAVNPKPGEAFTFDENAPPYAATCRTTNGVTILQINYMDDFVDIFRFEGWNVEKAGSFAVKSDGLIHWTEHLQRQSE